MLCIQKEEDVFEVVRKYVRDNPGQGIAEISEATGVPTKKIFGYIRDERLKIADAVISCRRCGKGVESGHLCPPCLREFGGLADAFAAHAAPEEPEKELQVPERQTHKMHIKARRR
jgi:hypothetical protein